MPPGPRSREISARLDAVECPAFDARRASRAAESASEQAPIVYERAIGANVIDVDGNRYVDLVGGFGAAALGHSPPWLSDAIARQSEQLPMALGDVYASEVKLALCDRLALIYPEPGARVMLGLSGADAITAALKTAVIATGRSGVIAFRGAYHGLSYAPLAACGLNEKFRSPFAEQLGDHVVFESYPRSDDELVKTLEGVKSALNSGKIGAILVEPILGRGGCVAPPAQFLPALRAACDDAGALLIADEIWTGLGRSGAMLASVEAGVVPDIICLGKALGAGLPVSACIGSARTMAAWGAHGGTAIHTATHFGAPIGCAVALAALERLSEPELHAAVRAKGDAWRAALAKATLGGIATAIDGRGLMVGITVKGGAAAALSLTRELLRKGYIVLTGGVRGDTLTLSPPLTIDERLLEAFTHELSFSASSQDG